MRACCGFSAGPSQRIPRLWLFKHVCDTDIIRVITGHHIDLSTVHMDFVHALLPSDYGEFAIIKSRYSAISVSQIFGIVASSISSS